MDFMGIPMESTGILVGIPMEFMATNVIHPKESIGIYTDVWEYPDNGVYHKGRQGPLMTPQDFTKSNTS